MSHKNNDVFNTRISEELTMKSYQTEHLFVGFMSEPIGQLNDLEKSSELESTPIILDISHKIYFVSICV